MATTAGVVAHRLDAARMVRLCRHPGCNRPVRASAGTKPCSYCEEHVRAPRTDGAARRGRYEAQIRADLRAQLYAMLAPWEMRLSRWRQNGAFLGGE